MSQLQFSITGLFPSVHLFKYVIIFPHCFLYAGLSSVGTLVVEAMTDLFIAISLEPSAAPILR